MAYGTDKSKKKFILELWYISCLTILPQTAGAELAFLNATPIFKNPHILIINMLEKCA